MFTHRIKNNRELDCILKGIKDYMPGNGFTVLMKEGMECLTSQNFKCRYP